MSPENEKYLQLIENALTVAVLDDKEPITHEEVCYEGMCGNGVDRWADKSLTNITFKNGMSVANADVNLLPKS
ncbi:unnamed protein product, partial [Oppiella nova]